MPHGRSVGTPWGMSYPDGVVPTSERVHPTPVYEAFACLAIFAALLCFILIGIPIAIALFWAGLIVKIFGRVVLFYVLGESLLKAFGAKNIRAVGASLLGLLIVSFVGFIPFIGFLFTLVLSILGWGAVIRTKFGTTDHWLGRKPPSPAAV